MASSLDTCSICWQFGSCKPSRLLVMHKSPCLLQNGCFVVILCICGLELSLVITILIIYSGKKLNVKPNGIKKLQNRSEGKDAIVEKSTVTITTTIKHSTTRKILYEVSVIRLRVHWMGMIRSICYQEHVFVLHT